MIYSRIGLGLDKYRSGGVIWLNQQRGRDMMGIQVILLVRVAPLNSRENTTSVQGAYLATVWLAGMAIADIAIVPKRMIGES